MSECYICLCEEEPLVQKQCACKGLMYHEQCIQYYMKKRYVDYTSLKCEICGNFSMDYVKACIKIIYDYLQLIRINPGKLLSDMHEKFYTAYFITCVVINIIIIRCITGLYIPCSPSIVLVLMSFVVPQTIIEEANLLILLFITFIPEYFIILLIILYTLIRSRSFSFIAVIYQRYALKIVLYMLIIHGCFFIYQMN